MNICRGRNRLEAGGAEETEQRNTEDEAVIQKLILAVLALVVFAGGMWLAVTAADMGNVVKPALRGWVMSQFPGILDNPVVLRGVRFGLGVILALAGVAVLLLTPWRQRSLRFRTEHGEVRVDMGALRRGVTAVARSLPEIRKAAVALHPLKDGRSIEVNTRLWLRDSTGQGLRHTAEVVANCIEEAVRLTLGLGGQVRVNLEIEGIEVDAHEITRRVQGKMEEEILAAALPRPPLAAVTLDPQRNASDVKEIPLPVKPDAASTSPVKQDDPECEKSVKSQRSSVVTPPPDELSHEELARLAAIESERDISGKTEEAER